MDGLEGRPEFEGPQGGHEMRICVLGEEAASSDSPPAVRSCPACAASRGRALLDCWLWTVW